MTVAQIIAGAVIIAACAGALALVWAEASAKDAEARERRG